MSNTASAPAATFGFWTICALVLLRLAIGWHFYSEGIEKLEPGFTSAGLLSNATGPLGPVYRSFVPSPGDLDANLATPRKAGSITDEQAEENATWRAAYAAEVKKSTGAGETPLTEFAPYSPYSDWAKAIAEDWRTIKAKAAKLAGGSEEAEQQAEEVFRTHLQQLDDYLASEADAIEEYRHELWRLEQMQDSPGAQEIDYREERIADKQADTAKKARGWKAAAATLEESYVDALVDLPGMGDGQQSAANQLRSPSPLDWIDPAVMCVVTGVGVCMLLGFCTRFAGIVGAGFLLSVMASQPPWVPGADTTYLGYQLVELGAMLTVAAVGAGRWYGIDSVLRRYCSLCCGPNS